MNTIDDWIEVVSILATDPTALVRCPECGRADLRVTDVVTDRKSGIGERCIACPACDAHTEVRKQLLAIDETKA